jgi:hypothetical protein
MARFTEIHYIDAHSGEYASFGLPPEHYFDDCHQNIILMNSILI